MAGSTEFSSNSLYKQCDESCMAINICLVCLSRLSASSVMSCMMAIVSKSTSLPNRTHMELSEAREAAHNWPLCSFWTMLAKHRANTITIQYNSEIYNLSRDANRTMQTTQ